MSKLISFLFLINCFVGANILRSQTSYPGVWKGSLYSNSIMDSTAQILYLKIVKYKSICEVNFRIEQMQSISFITGKITGVITADSLEFQDVILDSKGAISFLTEKGILRMRSNDSTGYITGELINKKSMNITHRLILYKVNEEFISGEKKQVNHSWFSLFQKEFLMGMLAPELRERERQNFLFQSVYFDPAKADLSPDYYVYLRKIINVVNGHSDLRLKVIGHTDWDGSDIYNEKLSKKRAEVIISFLEKNGLSRDRIEYEYLGEKKPIDTNKTSEGRKRNRRVDFQFI
ncbi:MAG: OmpA family protein [Bacteroidetes bacterium]|nr:OmpA family protein [Bacteroidota bacterium]